MSRGYSSGQLVGIDLHRRRSVICRMSAEGEVLESVRIDNDRAGLLREVAKAGAGAPVAIEATYGWYWAVDALQEQGFQVHLAHPKGLRSFEGRRVKTDWVGAPGAGRPATAGPVPRGLHRPTAVAGTA